METTTTNNLKTNTSNTTLTNNSITYLKETAKWAHFLAILGFITVGFMVLGGLFAGTLISSIPAYDDIPMSGGLIGAIYIVIAIIYIFPVLYLYKFAASTKKAIQQNNQSSLEEGLKNLKSHYKFIGIFAIITLSFYLLIFIISLIGGMIASSF